MKKLRLLILLALVLVVSGCSKVSTSSDEKTISTNETTNKTVEYVNLSDSEKNEMTFQFTRNSSASNVDLKVINRTNKNVGLVFSDIMLVHGQNDKTSASKRGKISIKSNSTKNIKGLFTNLSATNFQTVGLFEYRNNKNKLAYSETSKLVSRSSNLTNTTLKKSYKSKTKKKETEPDDKKEETDETEAISSSEPDTTSDTENDSSNNSEADSSTTQTNDSSSTSVNSSQDAINLIKSQNQSSDSNYSVVINHSSGSTDTVKDKNGDSVYWIRGNSGDSNSGNSGDDWTIYPNGYVVHSKPSM